MTRRRSHHLCQAGWIPSLVSREDLTRIFSSREWRWQVRAPPTPMVLPTPLVRDLLAREASTLASRPPVVSRRAPARPLSNSGTCYVAEHHRLSVALDSSANRRQPSVMCAGGNEGLGDKFKEMLLSVERRY